MDLLLNCESVVEVNVNVGIVNELIIFKRKINHVVGEICYVLVGAVIISTVN